MQVKAAIRREPQCVENTVGTNWACGALPGTNREALLLLETGPFPPDTALQLAQGWPWLGDTVDRHSSLTHLPAWSAAAPFGTS